MARRTSAKNRNGFWHLGNAPQPFSPVSVAKHSRLRGATVVNGVCPYCAVGCAQLVYTKDGRAYSKSADEA